VSERNPLIFSAFLGLASIGLTSAAHAGVFDSLKCTSPEFMRAFVDTENKDTRLNNAGLAVVDLTDMTEVGRTGDMLV
jgi:hypothetical protein